MFIKDSILQDNPKIGDLIIMSRNNCDLCPGKENISELHV